MVCRAFIYNKVKKKKRKEKGLKRERNIINFNYLLY